MLAQLKNNLSLSLMLLILIPLLSAINHPAPVLAKTLLVKQDTCPARPQGNKIARTIMALAAAKNCTNFPLSTEQVESKLQTLNCNAKTDKAIKNMKEQMMPKMEALYKGPSGAMMCQQATKF